MQLQTRPDVNPLNSLIVKFIPLVRSKSSETIHLQRAITLKLLPHVEKSRLAWSQILMLPNLTMSASFGGMTSVIPILTKFKLCTLRFWYYKQRPSSTPCPRRYADGLMASSQTIYEHVPPSNSRALLRAHTGCKLVYMSMFYLSSHP